jgi:hypothetical protein
MGIYILKFIWYSLYKIPFFLCRYISFNISFIIACFFYNMFFFLQYSNSSFFFSCCYKMLRFFTSCDLKFKRKSFLEWFLKYKIVYYPLRWLVFLYWFSVLSIITPFSFYILVPFRIFLFFIVPRATKFILRFLYKIKFYYTFIFDYKSSLYTWIKYLRIKRKLKKIYKLFFWRKAIWRRFRKGYIHKYRFILRYVPERWESYGNWIEAHIIL